MGGSPGPVFTVLSGPKRPPVDCGLLGRREREVDIAGGRKGGVLLDMVVTENKD